MNLELAQQIRTAELERVVRLLPERSRILEVGAGAGWQAKQLSELGYSVEAIEREQASYRNRRAWEIRTYDGENIPFADHSFDVVFSSNVLEHVPHVEAFQAELLRVLAPKGLAVHIMPTVTWRIATTLTHYPDLLKRSIARLRARIRAPIPDTAGAESGPPAQGIPPLRELLLPPRHGAHGNVFSEAFWFSRQRWLALFRRTGWRVAAVEPVHLFYSGNLLLGKALPLSTRSALSRVLGSSGLIYVLRPPGGTSQASG